MGYTDGVPSVDTADGAMRLGHFYVCKACSSSLDKTKLPKEHLHFFLISCHDDIGVRGFAGITYT